MSLKNDLDIALTELSESSNLPKILLSESGWCRLSIPIPASIMDSKDGELSLEIQLSPTGSFFSLSTPIAIIPASPDPAFLEALFHRQLYANQVCGASFALVPQNENNILVVIYHWVLDSITAKQFKQLYQRFLVAVFTLSQEVSSMIEAYPKHNE
ncbi:type III secretion system chaperone [Tumidithrix helvetica PCC 7403]|uniref:type III secretion system chaperone n=1 Tax=Tumidithrix helvetica TaxID=3457545 RepID=UPI003CB600CD